MGDSPFRPLGARAPVLPRLSTVAAKAASAKRPKWGLSPPTLTPAGLRSQEDGVTLAGAGRKQLGFTRVLTRRGCRPQNGTFRLTVGGESAQQLWFREVPLWEQEPQPW